MYKYALAFGPTSWQLTPWKRVNCQEEGLDLDIHLELERNDDKLCLRVCAIEKSGYPPEKSVLEVLGLCLFPTRDTLQP